jgi:hypothetical protein
MGSCISVAASRATEAPRKIVAVIEPIAGQKITQVAAARVCTTMLLAIKVGTVRSADVVISLLNPLRQV